MEPVSLRSLQDNHGHRDDLAFRPDGKSQEDQTDCPIENYGGLVVGQGSGNRLVAAEAQTFDNEDADGS